jgi:6,7-dimethyl-8-ribityllumazine synthase
MTKKESDTMKKITGLYDGKGLKVAIIMSRFNDLVGKQLVEGAKEGLLKLQVNESDITLIEIPGAFEMPLVTQKVAKDHKFDAIICCGAVIRGATPHFDMVANEVTKGIATVSLHTSTPIINAVLTTDSMEQALERAGLKAGNKGYEAALVAVEMVSLLKQL